MALGTRVFKIHSVSHFLMILSLGLNHCIFSDKQWFKAIMVHPSIHTLEIYTRPTLAVLNQTCKQTLLRWTGGDSRQLSLSYPGPDNLDRQSLSQTTQIETSIL